MKAAHLEGGDTHEDGKKPAAKKHLHKIITEHVVDHKGKHKGYVHHHVYKDSHDSAYEHPPRPMAVGETPEDVGAHHEEQWAQAGGAGPAEPAEGGGGAAEEPEEEAGE